MTASLMRSAVQVLIVAGAFSLLATTVRGASEIVIAIRENGQIQKRGFLVGQVMRASQGKADPQEVNRLIDERLNAGSRE